MLENGVMLSIQVAMLHDILSSSERIVQREVVHTVWNGCNFRAGREPVDIVPFALIAVKNPPHGSAFGFAFPCNKAERLFPLNHLRQQHHQG